MIIAIIIATVLSMFSSAAAGDLQPAVRGEQRRMVAPPPPPEPAWPTSFVAFECQWVEDKLHELSVKPRVIAFLVPTAKRESNCCPFIQGQDRTDANCNVTHVAAGPPHHRSDTGLFMINGIHYRTADGLACPEFTCSQDVLRMDIGMQFDVMLELYAECGQRPWTAPNYGCAPDWPFTYQRGETS